MIGQHKSQCTCVLTGVLRHGQVQWWADLTLSLDTDLTILSVEAGVCEILRSRMPLVEELYGANWKAFEELLFRGGMFDDKFCLHPFTSNLEQDRFTFEEWTYCVLNFD